MKWIQFFRDSLHVYMINTYTRGQDYNNFLPSDLDYIAIPQVSLGGWRPFKEGAWRCTTTTQLIRNSAQGYNLSLPFITTPFPRPFCWCAFPQAKKYAQLVFLQCKATIICNRKYFIITSKRHVWHEILFEALQITMSDIEGMTNCSVWREILNNVVQHYIWHQGCRFANSRLNFPR